MDLEMAVIYSLILLINGLAAYFTVKYQFKRLEIERKKYEVELEKLRARYSK